MSKFFYAIHEDDDSELIVVIDGPFVSREVALENAFLNCNSGEPDDPVLHWQDVVEVKKGRFVWTDPDSDLESIVSISDNGGCVRDN